MITLLFVTFTVGGSATMTGMQTKLWKGNVFTGVCLFVILFEGRGIPT